MKEHLKNIVLTYNHGYESKSIFKVKFKDGRQYLGSAEDIVLYNEK